MQRINPLKSTTKTTFEQKVAPRKDNVTAQSSILNNTPNAKSHDTQCIYCTRYL